MWIIIVSVWLRTYNLRVWELEKKPKFLILEPWITPSIFEEVNVGENKLKIVDEYTYAQYVDKEFAKTRLDRYKNWITLWKLNRECMKFCRTLQRFWFLLLNSSHRWFIPWMYVLWFFLVDNQFINNCMTASWPLWHSNSVRNQLLFTVKPQTVVANLAYCKDMSSRQVNEIPC